MSDEDLIRLVATYFELSRRLGECHYLDESDGRILKSTTGDVRARIERELRDRDVMAMKV